MANNTKNSKKLTIIAGVIAIVLCLATTVGGTLALFSASANLANNVLQAGSLSVKLERTAIQSTELNEKGVLVAGDEVVALKDFTNTNDNVFGLTDGDVIVPGSEYVASMRITNTGTVAFDFVATLNVTDNDDAKKLSEQLEVLLLDKNGNDLTTGTVYAGTEDNVLEFKVVLRFKNLDSAINNTVMEAGAKVNIKIECTQSVQI